MNYKRMTAATLAGVVGMGGTVAMLIWAPLWLVWAAFTPYLVVAFAWDKWLDRFSRPRELVRLDGLGRPARFQVMGAGQLRPEEAAKLAYWDRTYGLQGGPSAGGGDKPPEAIPPTVARVLMRAHHPDSDQAERVADTGDLALNLLLAELAARGPWN